MMMLMVLQSATLFLLAGIHVLWALGYWWPIRDETELARAVAGFGGITRMPGALPSALVATALFGAGLWPWWVGAVPWPLWPIGTGALALVFLGRGGAAYLPAWRRLTPEEPFASNDRRFFGPLCLALGCGFLLILGAWL